MKISQKLKNSLAKLSILLLLLSHVTPVIADTITGSAAQNEDQKEAVITDSVEVLSAPEVSMEEESETVESKIVEETLPTPEEIPIPPIVPSTPVPSESEPEQNKPEITTDTSSYSAPEATNTSESTTGSSSQSTTETTQETIESSAETSQESLSESSSEEIESSTTNSTVVPDSTVDSSTKSSESEIVSSSVEKESTTPTSTPLPSKDEQKTDQMIGSSSTTPEVSAPNTPLVIFPSVSRPLDANLAVQSFVSSDLNGFELPLLNTYQDQREAALIVSALNYLNKPYEKGGQGPDSFDNLNYPRYIYQQVFSLSMPEDFVSMAKIGNKLTVEETKPGDLLVWEKEQKMGIYLGQNKFIMADDTLLKEEEKEKKLTKEKENTTTEIPGVRIFTLHPKTQEDGNEDQDLLTRYDFIGAPDYGVGKKAEWTLSAYGSKELSKYPASFDFQENSATNAFIDSIGESARDLGLKYDVFASVMIAQAILESGSGSSGLSIAPYHNLFGIKGSLGSSSVVLPTKEDNGRGELYEITSAFRVYPSYSDSLADYVDLIRSGISGNKDFYQGVWRSTAKNYLKATAELTGKYATDTFYYNKLNSLITTYNLTRFDEPRAIVGSAMMSLAEIPAEYRNKVRFPEYNGQNYNHSGSYGSDQCTWYVFNRVTQLGGRVGDFMGNGADWRDTGIREGYQTSDIPKAGYVVSFKQGIAGYHPLYGHVAFVEAVGEEGILISEGDASYLSYRIIPNEIALSSGVGYVAPK